MLLVLFLGFFATRLTLQELGDEKFGIYNIVGGIIAIFAIISLPIRDSLQRFFNVEYANERFNPDTVFFTSARLVKLMVIIITVLYETIGLYIINYVIKYPAEETPAVNIIFQISAITSIFGFIELPYVSLLYSRENMNVPAVCEIVAAILRILLLYLIVYIPTDILIPYACIFLFIGWGRYIFFRYYCRKHYVDCFLSKDIDDSLKKEMLGFSGWSFIESVAGISLTYISNVFINIFGGVLYNTAYGLSKSVQNAVVGFATNIVKAAEPQITSGTATQNIHYRDQLLMTTVKISFLFIAFVYIVIHFDGELLLGFWLGNIPLYTVEFCEVMMLSIVFTSISMPFRILIMATGKVKGYFTSYGMISLLAMLSMYIFLKLDFPIISVLYIIMFSSIITLISAIYFSYKNASINVRYVLKNIILSSIALIGSGFTYYIVRNCFNYSLVSFVLAVFISFFVLLVATYFITLNEAEKLKIKEVIGHITRKSI